MPMVYPVHADADEGDQSYEALDSDLSDQWYVEVTPRVGDEELDSITFGPLSPQAAWDFAHELEDARPYWTCVVAPLYEGPANVQEFIEVAEGAGATD